ncbi:MAG TPA: hypothetical protein HA218_01515 [Nanoarchaeota archaeon]|nr:hypothetical protein [Nanoarchaeota archaeon]
MTKNYDPLDMSKVGEIRVALVNWLDLLPKNTEFELGGTAITSQAERNLRCIVDDVNYHIKRRKNLEKYINIKDLYTAVGNAKLALSILRSVRKMQERHIRQIRVVRG